MKRNYLRGIGIGIILSALLMGIFTGSKKMTDQEVKERAKQLGMVEQQEVVLSDLKEEKEETQESAETKSSEVVENSEVAESSEAAESDEVAESSEVAENSEVAESSEADSSEALESSEMTEGSTEAEGSSAAESSSDVGNSSVAESGETEESAEEASSESEESSEAKETSEASGTVTIVIKNCSSSLQLAKIVADAGLVSDAKAFDDFLCQHGYDRKINNGTYEIPVGSTEEEIAKIVTTKKKK